MSDGEKTMDALMKVRRIRDEYNDAINTLVEAAVKETLAERRKDYEQARLERDHRHWAVESLQKAALKAKAAGFKL